MGLVGTTQGSCEKRTDNHHFSFFFFFAPSFAIPPFKGASENLAAPRMGQNEGKKAGDERDRALLPGRNRVEEAFTISEVGLPDESVFDKRGKNVEVRSPFKGAHLFAALHAAVPHG